MNAALYTALAEGQEHLLEERWAATEAAEVARLLHEGSLRLFHAALRDAEVALDEARRVDAVMHARGLWLAAAEAMLTLAPEAVAEVEAALAGTGDTVLIPFAAEAVEAALAHLAG